MFSAKIVLFLSVMTADAGLSSPASPVVGRRHPEFSLPDIETGKPVSLSDFRGKKILLIQFASW